MTRLLGIAGLFVAASVGYLYWKRTQGDNVASGQVSTPTTATIATDTGNAGAGISSVPKPASTLRSGVQVSSIRFGSVAKDATNASMATPQLFTTRRLQGFS